MPGGKPDQLTTEDQKAIDEFLAKRKGKVTVCPPSTFSQSSDDMAKSVSWKEASKISYSQNELRNKKRHWASAAALKRHAAKRAEYLELFTAGASLTHIMQKQNVTAAQVRKMANALGFTDQYCNSPPKIHGRTLGKMRRIQALLDKGLTVREVAAKLQQDYSRVYDFVNKRKLHITNREISGRAKTKQEKLKALRD